MIDITFNSVVFFFWRCYQIPVRSSMKDNSVSFLITKTYGSINTVTCWVCYAWLIDGFWIGWLDSLTPYTFTTRDYSQYRAIADLHTLQVTVTHALGFSVFTSRIVATDLQQSHCNFKSHIKSYLHSLINFWPFLLNHLRLPSPELDPIIDSNSLKRPSLPLYNPSARTTQKTTYLLLRRLVYWSIA
jgi:hypothetical protein